MTEKWRDIEGYPNYVVSSSGNIAFELTMEHLTQKVNNNGDLVVWLGSDLKSRSLEVYLLMAKAFLGQAPFGEEPVHADGDRLHNDMQNIRFAPYKARTNIKRKFLITDNKSSLAIRILETNQEFPSAAHAGRALNLSPAKIRKALLSNQGKLDKYTFEFMDDEKGVTE